MFGPMKQPLPSTSYAILCTFLGVIAVPTGTSAAIDWVEAGPHRFAEITIPAGRTGFTKLGSAETGITFTNTLSDINAARNQILMNGSGVALGDVNGDGLCDIYAAGLEGNNQLLINLGDWRFKAVTNNPAIECRGQASTGATFADVNGDGQLDLLVNAIGRGTRLFLNRGDANFEEAVDSGLTNRLGAMSMALADVEGDGDLDLYVANYRTTTIRSTGIHLMTVDGRQVLRPEDRDDYEITPNGYIREHGDPDILYINDGNGRFTPASWTEGRFLDEDGRPLTAAPRDWGLSVVFRDMNLDGAPDIYVCNDFWSPERIWINDGNGGFRAIGRNAIRSTSSFSMGADFGDINRDGFDDLFVLDMLSPSHVSRMVQISGAETGQIELIEDRTQVERNTLLLNRGDGTYVEIARLAGIEATGWSWGTAFLDVDLDGFEDILVSNGYSFDTQDADAERYVLSLGPQPPNRVHLKLLNFPRHELPNMSFRNNGDLTFQATSSEWGFDFKGISQGMALADLDNDGDLDVVTNDLNTGLGIYRNDASAPRIQVRLRGTGASSHGIGARVSVNTRGARQQQGITSGGRYLSGDQAVRTFAASGDGPFEISVRWPDGTVDRVNDAEPNRIYEIHHTGTSEQSVATPLNPKPLFRDRSDWIAHEHIAEPDNDFDAAPLLPWKRSTTGPAVLAHDLNSDGWPDLVFGGGADSPPVVYWNKANDGFSAPDPIKLPDGFSNEVSAICGFATQAGEARVALGIVGPEESSILIVGADLETPQLIPFGKDWIGAIVAHDVDGDGASDLFVGGRPRPEEFPTPSDGRIFLQRDGRLVEDERNNEILKSIGIVNGAAWLRWNDGQDALIVATEWGPVRAFVLTDGILTEATQSLGLAATNGFWQGIAIGDFDNDGREDFVAGNWGRNSDYERHRRNPISLFAGDFDSDGRVDPVEAYLDPERNKTVPRQRWDQLARGIPYVRARFFTHRDYGLGSVHDAIGNVIDTATKLEATVLESCVFLNRGDRFEIRPLPIEAQFAPAFTPVVADFNRDGIQDLFLSQNFFGTRYDASRMDAGRGLLLIGDGNGGFRSTSASESGVALYEEQRGATAADLDGDGDADLIITQRNGPAAILTNESGQSAAR